MAHTETKRDLIIKEASRIMYERGTGVGVDTLVSEIGVAKMTLYKHFPTKTDLIVARASALRVLELP